jgi:tetratricopeptide (TPR) repeat protein
MTMAKLNLALSQTKAAVEASEKAARCFNDAGDEPGEGTAWASIMAARFAAGDADGGKQASYAALALFEELEDKLGYATVLLKFAQAQLKRKDYSEALPAAVHALTFFRNNRGGALEFQALDVVVAAYAKIGQGGEAVSLAKQSVASARKQRASSADRGLSISKRYEGLALLSLAYAHLGENFADAAWQAASDALSIFQELDDKPLQARTNQALAQVKLSGQYFDDAIASAEDAATMYDNLGDTSAASAATELKNAINTASEKDYKMAVEASSHYEKEREIDLMCLSELAHAVRTRDKETMKEKYPKVRRSKHLTAEDWMKVMPSEGTEQIWMYSNIGGNPIGGPERHPLCHERYIYIGMRTYGMHYGPGFRLLHMGGGQGENPLASVAYGLLTLHKNSTANEGEDGLEPNHSWENLSWYHAGMLDCGLQASGARQFMRIPGKAGDEHFWEGLLNDNNPYI